MSSKMIDKDIPLHFDYANRDRLTLPTDFSDKYPVIEDFIKITNKSLKVNIEEKAQPLVNSEDPNILLLRNEISNAHGILYQNEWNRSRRLLQDNYQNSTQSWVRRFEDRFKKEEEFKSKHGVNFAQLISQRRQTTETMPLVKTFSKKVPSLIKENVLINTESPIQSTASSASNDDSNSTSDQTENINVQNLIKFQIKYQTHLLQPKRTEYAKSKLHLFTPLVTSIIQRLKNEQIKQPLLLTPYCFSSLIEYISPIPKSQFWMKISKSVISPDDKKLKVHIYVGDNESIDTKEVELDQSPDDICIPPLGEAEELTLIYIIEKYKKNSHDLYLSKEVYLAIQNVFSIPRREIAEFYANFTDGPFYKIIISKNQKYYQLMEQKAISKRLRGKKYLLDLIGNEFSSFNIDNKDFRAKGIGIGLGIVNLPHFDQLVNTYSLLCRRCYIYLCPYHPTEENQPLPITREDPLPPFSSNIACKFQLPTDFVRIHRRSTEEIETIKTKPILVEPPFREISLNSNKFQQILRGKKNHYESERFMKQLKNAYPFLDSFKTMSETRANPLLQKMNSIKSNSSEGIESPLTTMSDNSSMDIDQNELELTNKSSDPTNIPETDASKVNNDQYLSLYKTKLSFDRSSITKESSRLPFFNSDLLKFIEVNEPPLTKEYLSSLNTCIRKDYILPYDLAKVRENLSSNICIQPAVTDAEIALIYKFKELFESYCPFIEDNRSIAVDLKNCGFSPFEKMNEIEYIASLLKTRPMNQIKLVLEELELNSIDKIFSTADIPIDNGKSLPMKSVLPISVTQQTLDSPLTLAEKQLIEFAEDDDGDIEDDDDDEDYEDSDDQMVSKRDNNSKPESFTDPKLKKLKKRKRNQDKKIQQQRNQFDVPYYPCSHEGPCNSDTDCSCQQNGTFCEKYCSCSYDCKNKFRGCDCKKGGCRTKSCPCYAAFRACDPDTCGVCTAYIHPDILPKVIFQMKYCYLVNQPISALIEKAELELGENDTTLMNAEEEIFRTCTNTDFKVRRSKKIQVAQSLIHGWGAFAAEPIKKNEFITEYLGELVSQEEADRRGIVYDKLKLTYLFTLHHEQVIDATRKGNKAKYLNDDGQNYNVVARIIRINGDHRVGLFAYRNIEPGEELTFNYQITKSITNMTDKNKKKVAKETPQTKKLKKD